MTYSRHARLKIEQKRGGFGSSEVAEQAYIVAPPLIDFKCHKV